MKAHIPGVIIVFAALMAILLAPDSTYGRVSLKERDALEALFNKTNGRNWLHQDNWKKAPGTESSWYGITCDAANTTVIRIKLKGNNLQGVLPADMDAFSNLIILDLSDNQLTGEIPRWIERLKNLKTLDLSNNNFKGHIPAWLGNLQNLEELLLDNNGLEGPIPVEVGDLSNLKVFSISSNRLTGVIPAALEKLGNLKDNRSDFKWNGLYTQDSEIKNFLSRKQIDKDWESTQTVPPAEIKAMSFTENSITIGWQPIPYTADKGGYRIFYREASRQDYDKEAVTEINGKAVHNVTLKDLKKDVKYIFRVVTRTESHNKNKNEIESVFSNEFLAATGGIIISGTITDKRNGEGFPGVLLTASNGGGNAETDKDGKYRLNVMTGWIGSVAPSRKGFKFSPPSINYESEVTSGISANDYIAESDTVISGTVTFKGKVVDNVTIKFEGSKGDDYSALTDYKGNYRLEVPYNWSGLATPIKYGHGFYPFERKYDSVVFPLDQQDYEVELSKVFGKIKMLGGKGVGGVKLKFSNMETDKFGYLNDYAVTDEKGNYENDVLENWIGNVKPESSRNNNYYFYPSQMQSEKLKKSRNAINFEAARKFKFFFVLASNFMHISKGTNNNNDNSNAISVGTIFCPEISLSFKFIKNFNIWLNYVVKNFNTKVLNKEQLWIHNDFSFGITYDAFVVRLSLGIARIRYKDYAFGDKILVKSMRLIYKSSYIININDRWFTEIYLGVLPIYKEYSSFNMGFGLGYRF